MTLHTTNCPLPTRKGQSALSMIILISAIVVFSGISMALLALSILNSTYGFRAGTQATEVAAAGIRDALLQLDRNKDFATSSYSLSVDSYTATINVGQQTSTVHQRVHVTSTATVSNYTRRIHAVVSISSSTGQFSPLSWQLQ